MSTQIDFFAGRSIARTDKQHIRRRYLIISLVSNLAVLGVFKYFNFFSENIIVLLNALGMQADPFTLRVLLPVGISFYTFQSMSYTIDIYRREIPPAQSWLDYSLFVAFFPQLVAGPIVRASEFLPQLASPRRINYEHVERAVCWIATGFIFKVGLADNLADSVDLVYNAKGDVLPSEAWLGTYYFAFQIFGDFCGYTLIARGVALLLGFQLPENFRAPYIAASFGDFWRRWHMSLSTWLRDYLYIPLGGNRYGIMRTYRNLFLTMLLGGLWHGASWNFIIWGALHGFYLTIERSFSGVGSSAGKTETSVMTDVVKIIVVFHAVCFAWIFFRAANLGVAMHVLSAMFNLKELFDPHMPNKALLKDLTPASVFVFYFASAYLREKGILRFRQPAFISALFLAAGVFLTIICRHASDAFIYFQF